MAKRYVLVSAPVESSSELIKSVNELLDKGYELYGSPQVSTGDSDVIYQAMTKS